jgi:hypothetical protein
MFRLTLQGTSAPIAGSESEIEALISEWQNVPTLKVSLADESRKKD